MGIPVKLQVFEGPLDLLLHLIDKNKIDIYDIPIVEITSQYMDYIKAMDKEDLNIMSEFLVMAATLLDIKCRMLLPKEVNEEGEEEDPRQELVEQLLEYKMYKYMSYELRDRQVEGEQVMYKAPTIPQEVLGYVEPVDLDALLGDLTLSKLNRIFKDVMKKQVDKIDPVRSKFGKIEKEEDGLTAAYRELWEETGITDADIELTHLMDFNYLVFDNWLEVYFGRLNKDFTVRGEENELLWIDISSDFFDVTQFAGRGNMGHIMELIKEYESDLPDEEKY